tara:strand:- start:3043 stop:3954 length:912 start_codon:yes stop_codon:yes gene_type:complete
LFLVKVAILDNKKKNQVVSLGLSAAVLVALVFWNNTNSAANYQYLKNIVPDVQNGKYVFTVAGCANCHTTMGKKSEFVLGGGMAFPTAFGTFYAPNISNSKDHGIGDWTMNDFATALKQGVGPTGEHYFPAFPYTSYRLISDQDLADLWAFWQTLPAEEIASRNHDLKFPFSSRIGLIGWKALYFNEGWVGPDNERRGRYLVESLGHCAECHTPRSFLGGLQQDKWLQGANSLTDKRVVPAITPKTLSWSVSEIMEYLSTGFTPDFDVVGGSMARVVENTSRLSREDLHAIAKYLVNMREKWE